MYKGKNGFTLVNDETPGGWRIKTPEDIATALQTYPVFQTVAEGFLWEAIGQAVTDRKEYQDIEDLAKFIATRYI